MESTIRIERYADQGRCVGHIDGRVVFVRFALPGELVRVALDEPHDREDRFWTGEVVEVLEASEDRTDPIWSLAGPLAMGGGVGGADLVHVSLAGQLKWKVTSVAEQMARLGHVDVEVPIERMSEDDAERGLHWRTRIEMIADADGRPSMHRRGTHVRVPIDTMPLASRTLLEVAEREHVWEGSFEPGSQIRLSVPEPRDNAPISDNYAVLVNGEVVAGSRELTEKVIVAGREFEYNVDAGGFWQMHRHAPIALTNHVIDLVRGELDGAKSACLWDLYSGSGLFTLPLATLTAERIRMLSVEGGKTAVRNAQRNLRHIHLGNVDARVGDVAKTLANVRNDLAKPDVVVLDPPRAGARAKVCRQKARAVSMPLFARRAFFGMTAIALSCAALSGCVPSNAAVGDTQSPDTAVAHSMEDRDSLSIAMIGSDDVTADSMAMGAMEAGKLKPVYITVSGTVDAQSTAQQGVRDMAQRKADLIIIAGIDANEANAENWNDALETARTAGVPVVLLNPIAVPKDNKLYAATMTVNDRMTDAIPLDDAAVAVANNDPHDREMLVTTITH